MSLKVGIMGATGLECIRALQNPHWFEISGLHISEDKTGRTLEEVYWENL